MAADLAPGLDGLVNDYFLIRTNHFRPRGELTGDQLAAEENLTAFRWWQLAEITGHTGPELFSPRDLTTPLTAAGSGQADRPGRTGPACRRGAAEPC